MKYSVREFCCKLKEGNVTFHNVAEVMTRIYIAVMLAVFPLFTGISGYNLLQDKKYYFFLLCTLLWLISLAVCTVGTILKKQRFRLHFFEVGFVLVAILCVLSCALSPTGFPSSLSGVNHNGLITFLLYFLIIMGIAHYGHNEKLHIHALAISYTICTVIALIQLLGFNVLWLYPGELNYYSPLVIEYGRFLGTVGNIDIMSAFHCLAIPVLILFGINLEGKSRYILLFPCLLGIVVLALSGVSSGVVGLGAAFAAFAPWSIGYASQRKLQPKSAKKLTIILYGVVFLLLCLFVFCVYQVRMGEGTLSELHDVLHGRVRDEFGSSRIRIWKECLKVIREYPWFGIGPDRVAEYTSIVASRYSELLGETITAQANDAHNIYLQFLLNFGLLPAIPAILMLVGATFMAVRRAGQSPDTIAVGAGLFCFAVQGFFNISTCIVDPIVCVLLGLFFSSLWELRGTERK